MGFCTEGQTSHGPVDVEFRRESVTFHEGSEDPNIICYDDGHVEITYQYLRRIAELLDDPAWRARLLGEK